MKKLIYSQEDLDLILSLTTQEKDEELERYKNIIDELEKWFEEKDNGGYEKLYVEDILYKLKELKERNKIDE